jgi:positive regulator of sigma E activity
MSDSCEFGRIAEVTESQYRIVLDENSSCKSCGMNELCAQKEILLDREEVGRDFDVNEPVELVFEKVVQTSFLLYMVPLIFFFMGILIPQYVFHLHHELVLFVLASASMTLSFFFIRLLYKRLDKETYRVKLNHKTQIKSTSLYTGERYAN